MPNPLRRTLHAVLALATTAAIAAPAQASYPDRPITLVFPWSTGSGIDAVTRAFAERLGNRLGQPVIVQAKPGAASTIGATYVQRAAPDGYTLLIGDGGTFSVVNQSRKEPAFDTLRDFEPISLLVKTPYFVLTNAESPIRSLDQLIGEAKTRPGALAYGNVGVGSMGHLAVEDFANRTGIDLIAVPYKGSGEVLAALLGNTIQLSFTGGALTHITGGRVRGLAVGSEERLQAAPDLPTVRELTGSDFVAEAWWGIVAPKGTPAPVIEVLNRAIGEVAAEADLQSQFAAWGFVFGTSTPAGLTHRIQDETVKWGSVIRELGLQPS